LPISTAVVASGLLIAGNRFGMILLLPLLGSLFHLQESANFWDALMDPLYGATSLGVVSYLLWRRLR